MDNEVGHVYIPAFIMAMEDLSILEKVLYGKIVGLCGTQGYCYASNEWLGKQLDKDDDTIRKWITKLISKGILRRELTYNEKNEVTSRRLYPFIKEAGAESTGGVGAKLPGGGGKINRYIQEVNPRKTVVVDKDHIDYEKLKEEYESSLSSFEDSVEKWRLWAVGKVLFSPEGNLRSWLSRDIEKQKALPKGAGKYNPIREDPLYEAYCRADGSDEGIRFKMSAEEQLNDKYPLWKYKAAWDELRG